MSQTQCPKCAQPLRDDYGMVTCPKCGSFVFVDMDGVAHFSEDEPARTAAVTRTAKGAGPAPAKLPDLPVLDSPGDFEPLSFDTPDVEPGNEPAAPAQEPSWEQSLRSPPEHSLVDLQTPSMNPHDEADVHVALTPSYESTSEPSLEAPLDAPAEEFDMDKMLGYQEPDVEAPSADFSQPGDPLGTSDYANSEISQAKDGPLIFKILISGIDSKEMRESLRSALDDQRFGWNPNDLMSRISKGVLVIENVAPVKAVILINRIKRLPVRIRWEQYAITQMG